MSNASEEIKKKIQNMSFKEYSEKGIQQEKSSKKGSFIGKLLFWRLKVIKDILGIDLDSSSSSNTGSSHHGQHAPHGGNVRETYKVDNNTGFDPQKWLIKEMQAEAYHDLVDGKGDDECGHGH